MSALALAIALVGGGIAYWFSTSDVRAYNGQMCELLGDRTTMYDQSFGDASNLSEGLRDDVASLDENRSQDAMRQLDDASSRYLESLQIRGAIRRTIAVPAARANEHEAFVASYDALLDSPSSDAESDVRTEAILDESEPWQDQVVSGLEEIGEHRRDLADDVEESLVALDKFHCGDTTDAFLTRARRSLSISD